MPAPGQKAPGTGWANPSHPAHRPASGLPPMGVEGNLAALKSGALSARAVDPVASELVAQALANVPFLSDPAYRPALEAWANAEAKCRLLDAYLARVGVVDDDGKPRAALDALRLWENRASAERARLGLDPLSRAKLGKDVTATQVNLRDLMGDDDG